MLEVTVALATEPVVEVGAAPEVPLGIEAELEGLGVSALYLGSDEFHLLFA